MKRFQKILVGVDLAAGDRLVSDRYNDPTRQAISVSLALAQVSGAEICFFYAIDVDAAAERMIEEQADSDWSILDQAEKVLGKIIALANEKGITATSRVVIGRSWQKIIQEVQGRGHDLVIVGTRDPGLLKRILMGTTAMRLLRRCPCPVLVVKPGKEILKSVLVAHDMSPVGALATELAGSIAELTRAELHVLHSLKHAQYEDVPLEFSRPQVSEVELRIEASLLGREANVHLTDEDPSQAILDAIDKYKADILVMGTIARAGFSELFIGNTAERILPLLSCSVLAVKPDGFESGIE